jgi:YaiO family outer membrane protein
MASLSLSRQFSFGSVVGRMKKADRLQTEGTQFEIDAYPHLREGTYLYLNAGTSNDSIFPKTRYGVEAYQSFENAYEVSLGLRYLAFTNSIVRILTASVGKYIGNYYFVFRTNVVPDESGNSLSGRLQVRRYFGDEDYLQLTVSAGDSPTFASSSQEVVVLKSNSVSIDLYHSIVPSWYGSLGLGHSDEEIRQGVVRGDWSFSAGIEKRF